MDKLFDLSGRRILVTGSTQGIGLALATGFAERGARVVLNGRNAERMARARDGLAEAGHEVEGAVFDVTEPEAVGAAVAELEADGPLDVLVNNAGMQHRAPLEDFPEDAWETLLRTNVTSAFLVGKAVAKHMIARGRGKIINIASIQSELARTGIAPYTATKGAVRNLTRGMATDWARHGLQVNAIAPGYFRTPLNKALIEDPAFDGWLRARTPAGRWGELGELVGVAVFLASQASSFVNGQTIFVDGGISVCL